MHDDNNNNVGSNNNDEEWILTNTQVTAIDGINEMEMDDEQQQQQQQNDNEKQTRGSNNNTIEGKPDHSNNNIYDNYMDWLNF